MKDGHNYRIWSVARQKFLKIENDKTSITCTGTGHEDGTGTEGSCILKAKHFSTSDANGWQFEFELADNGTKKTYALDVTGGNNFTAFEVTSNNPVTSAAYFVPGDFGQTDQTGPFKALKYASKQCIAANIKDGSMSLKAFDPIEPHPGTFFVISEI